MKVNASNARWGGERRSKAVFIPWFMKIIFGKCQSNSTALSLLLILHLFYTVSTVDEARSGDVWNAQASKFHSQKDHLYNNKERERERNCSENKRSDFHWIICARITFPRILSATVNDDPTTCGGGEPARKKYCQNASIKSIYAKCTVFTKGAQCELRQKQHDSNSKQTVQTFECRYWHTLNQNRRNDSLSTSCRNKIRSNQCASFSRSHLQRICYIVARCTSTAVHVFLAAPS